MTDVNLKVRPSGPGWQLESDANTQPMMFLSGAKAEAQAHALAKRMAASGADARVTVQDRGEQVVGATEYPADER
jgi:hypothetical protein